MKVDIKEIRREFHKYPEIGWQEFRTSARIAEILNSIGFEHVLVGRDVVCTDAIIPEVRLSEEEKTFHMQRAIENGADPKIVNATNGYPGVIAIFDTGIEGPVSAFRFDIDALPYGEIGEEAYRPIKCGYNSVYPNASHACGHDGHTAIGIGIAQELINSKIIKKGKVKIIFQPAEETFSGAESIVAKGHLDDVNYFMSAHLAISGNGGQLLSNSMCCGCMDFLSDRQIDVYYEGKAAHPCGASHEGKNALLAACSAALNLHSIAPHESGLFRVNVGEIHAGICINTIAPNAVIKVEYRGENPEISAYGKKRVETIIKSAAEMYDLNYRIVDYGEVPAGKSNVEMMEIIERAAKKVSWFENILFEGNVGGTDDATVMMAKVQSNGGIATYVGIGTDSTDVVHGEAFDFDESSLDAAVELFLNALEEIHN